MITLFILVGVLFSSAIINHTLTSLKNSVDVNIDILSTAPEEQIMTLKTELEKLNQVESVEYITRDMALENYRARHADKQELLAIIDELDENPLLASLNVRAKEIGEYESIQNFLNEKYINVSNSIIDGEVNYAKKKEVISKLSAITSAGEQFGFLVTVVFIFLSIVITLNTIRLTIFISRDEIQVMNLVGAGKGYISGPFVITGAFYGAVSAILVLVLTYPIAYFIGPKIKSAFFDFNLFGYYITNFSQFFLIIFFAGILIGSISSLFAINRYLKT
jgi:cell division transport system permease protein